jgi:hypothetical protein
MQHGCMGCAALRFETTNTERRYTYELLLHIRVSGRVVKEWLGECRVTGSSPVSAIWRQGANDGLEAGHEHEVACMYVCTWPGAVGGAGT